MKKRLLLLRHASHAASRQHRFLGSTDIGLAEHGFVEAASIAPLIQEYKPERFFSSPLKRCIETIGQISPPHVEINPDLREIDFGRWEGMTFDQIRQSDPDAVRQWAAYDPGFSFPGGERISDFLTRVRQAAKSFVSCSEKTVLKKEPLLDLDLRLGEGTGAALAMHLVEAAVRILTEVASFDEAAVSTADK